jgi:hypothetical protein
MYCSIEDAWGSDFNNDVKSVDSDKSEEFKAREYKLDESPVNERKQYMQYMQLKEKFGNPENHDDKVCIAVNTHINKCATCRARYMKNLQRPSISISTISEQIMEKINNNSDTVTLILICIMILLIIKLFNK